MTRIRVIQPGRNRRRRWCFWLLVVTSCAAWSCGRDSSQPTSRPAVEDDPDRITPPAQPPEYSFADGVREEFPQIAAFMRQFLETCLAGDYAGYRRMVSRRAEPEPRDRFGAIAHAVAKLEITKIEQLELPALSDEVYRVLVKVGFHPESNVRLRRKTNEVGILVLREDGELRLMPAMAELQPKPEPPPTTTSAPAEATPDYPWDEDVDY